MAITLHQRSTYRSSISWLKGLQERAELSLRTGAPLTPLEVTELRRMTGTTELSSQTKALDDFASQSEAAYLELLKQNSSKSLSCFVEYMTPDEPPAPHHEWMGEKLEAIARRDIMRAAFSLHPGGAKTKFCSRYFPAWYLGNYPNHRWLQGGHSQAFVENEFGKYVRDIIIDPKYAEVFPDAALHPRSSAAGSWRLRQPARGGYVAKGVGQKIAGYRGHIGGIDDAIGSKEDADSAVIRNSINKWLFADFRTRLLPGSPLFLVATRWHEEDPIGFIETLNKQGKGIPWQIFNLTAVIETEEEMANDPLGRSMGEPMWADYYNYETLMDLKATLPARDWWALYKGRPRPEEGNVVKVAWFQRYSRLPRIIGTPEAPREARRVTVSVDCANSAAARAAYTVATVWIEDLHGRHYLAEVMRERLEFNDLVTKIEALAAKWHADAILVENKGAGTQYIQQRGGKAPAPVIKIEVPNTHSKEFRFDGTMPMFEGGLVLLPNQASWLEVYQDELLSFPTGTYDDQVDSTSQYLNWARKRRKYGTKKLGGTKLAA